MELEGVEPSRATVQGSPAPRSTTPSSVNLVSCVPQLQLPSSRRPVRPGGDFSSRSVRWPPVASDEAPGPARIAPLCGSSQAAPGFPECPEEDSNPLAPTWRAGRAAGHEKGRPAGPPSTRMLVVARSSLRQCDLGARAEGSVRRHASPKACVSTACGCTSIHNASSCTRRCLAGMYSVSICFTIAGS